ncbi:MAG: type 4a pilus biogenesis protein PilO [Candidatus Hydrogenedentes bacterium]|nr:type 4a pilus biogenesis protein PilO [Candidatus Hydrogenedentota bacterium]
MEFLRGTVTPKDWMNVGIILGITLLIASVYFFIVDKGLRENYQILAEKEQVLQKDVTEAERTNANIETLREEAQKYETLVSDFEKRLPAGREIPTLVQKWEAIGHEIGVEMGWKDQPRITQGLKETLPYSVVARGTFHQIASFINRLERFERYVKISDLNMGEQKMGVCEAKFTLSTYTFVQATRARTTTPGPTPGTPPAETAPAPSGAAS